MLIYELKETEGELDIETLAYIGIEKGASLILIQGIYRGPEVVAHSSIILDPIECAKIVTTLSQIEIHKFLPSHKAK